MPTREVMVAEALEMALELVAEKGTGRGALVLHSVEAGVVATEMVSLVMNLRGHLGEIMSATAGLAMDMR